MGQSGRLHVVDYAGVSQPPTIYVNGRIFRTRPAAQTPTSSGAAASASSRLCDCVAQTSSLLHSRRRHQSLVSPHELTVLNFLMSH